MLLRHHGKLRVYDVSMGGTKWRPELPTREKLDELLQQVEKIDSVTDREITLMCKLMKMQLFNDGNKRTAMLVANKELIKNGKGIISISEDSKEEFGIKLINYYENENALEDLKEFVLNNCLDGIIV